MMNKNQKNKIKKFSWFNNATISWKLSAIYALLFACVLLAFSACLLYGLKYYFVYESKQQVQGTSAAMVTDITAVPGKETAEAYDTDLSLKFPPEEYLYVRRCNAKGKTIVSSSESFKYPAINKPFGKTIKKEYAEKHLIYRTNKIIVYSGRVIYIQVVKDMSDEYQFLEVLFIFLAILDFAGLIISFVIGYVMSRKILSPITYITNTAKSISAQDLEKRINIQGPNDELNILAATFNEMIERLQISFALQKQFVSDASHELRTPLSVIQGYASLLDRWGKEDKDVLDEAIQAINDETKSMSKLIEDLLFMARSSNGDQRIFKEKYLLSEQIEEIVRESKLISLKHVLLPAIEDNICVEADRTRIKQAIRAIIDNCMKYTPDGGSIRIDLKLIRQRAVIEISDTGIGIAPEDLPRIFDRFFCVDKARGKERCGTGLGLPIAKLIVEAHAGTIRVQSVLGQGTTIYIELPIA